MINQQEIFKKVASGELKKDEAMKMLHQIYNNSPAAELSQEKASEKITEIVISILHLSKDEINGSLTFSELGADSISAVEIIHDINRAFNINLDAVIIYEHTTIMALADYILKLKANEPALVKASDTVERAETENVSKKDIPKPFTSKSAGLTTSRVQDKLIEIISNILHAEDNEISLDLSFREMGVDSISGVEIIRNVNIEYKLNLDSVVIYDFSNIRLLSKHICEMVADNENTIEDLTKETFTDGARQKSKAIKENKTDESISIIIDTQKHVLKSISEPQNGQIDGKSKSKLKLKQYETPEDKNSLPQLHEQKILTSSKPVIVRKSDANTDIAVIGMSGRFPGAKNVKEYWNNLVNGIDSITEVPKSRWNIDDYYDADPHAPGKTNCRKCGFLDDVDLFDPLFFNISPREAEMIDPQQRLFLEESWKAIEDAGYSDTDMQNVKCGVFVGAAASDYLRKLQSSGLYLNAASFTGISTAVLAGRVSYFLNLKGPSITLDTACSSSLVAIHLACQSILNGECSMALAGGIRLMLTPDLLIHSSQMGIISPDGINRAFDRAANGTVLGEGVGVLVLKTLAQAIEDNDYIYGVIKASSVNQNGKTNGLTAPNVRSQLDLELDVYSKSGINPEKIGYIETHGTGTVLGDPIEIKALTDAFRTFTGNEQFCAIGSVKTNIGHTTIAAGVASMIKVLLSLKNNKIPPSLHFSESNEHIDFKHSPFFVNTKLSDWNIKKDYLRLAAVSSFGFSGTNCHMLVEQSPL